MERLCHHLSLKAPMSHLRPHLADLLDISDLSMQCRFRPLSLHLILLPRRRTPSIFSQAQQTSPYACGLSRHGHVSLSIRDTIIQYGTSHGDLLAFIFSLALLIARVVYGGLTISKIFACSSDMTKTWIRYASTRTVPMSSPVVATG